MNRQQSMGEGLRHIHLDFHTPDFVKVGERFDPVRFFDTLEEADVNSITVFALCHHGNSYFNTTTGRRHPGLDFDLFGSMAEEAAKRSFPLAAYFSMNVNEYQARIHPEWAALWADGRPVNDQILQDGTELFWTWLCPNRGPLIEEFLFPQIAEVLDNYPINGVFIDMAGYLPGSCFCPTCIEQMHKKDMDPFNAFEHTRFNNDNMQQIARDLRILMDSRRPGLRLEMGCYNSYGEAHKAKEAISNFYVESLSFQTGWQYAQIGTRYFRKYDLPTLGMTGRFLKNWGDFGTVASPQQQKVQLATHLMAGVASCVGDHLPADGHFEQGVYDTIGQGFRFIKPRQPYCVGMVPAKEAAVLVTDGEGANAATMNANGGFADILDAYKGACKMMTELHYQYDVISTDDTLDGYSMLFVTHGFFKMDFVIKVKTYLEKGGTLIVSGHGLSSNDPETDAVWKELIGVGEFELSDHQGEFYKVTDQRLLHADHPLMAHYVHTSAIDASFSPEIEALAEGWRSPCVRSRSHHYGHFHGPAMDKTGAAAGTKKMGQGRIILLRPQIFTAYLQTGYYVHRILIRDLLDTFLPADKRLLRTNAPTVVEFALGEKDGRTILQAMPFITERRDRTSFESICEDPITLRGIWVELLYTTGCTRVVDPVRGQELEFEHCDQGLRINLPEFHEHLLVVIE